MGYMCRICGLNEVNNPSDVCEICAISEDPYAASLRKPEQPAAPVITDAGGSTSGYTPKISTHRRVLISGTTSSSAPVQTAQQTRNTPPVQVYSAGQTPQIVTPQPAAGSTGSAAAVSKNQPVTAGIAKNITADQQKRSALYKWFRSLFQGTPFSLDNDITMFQVFPDYDNTALNALGYACDQVIVYGKLNQGVVSENNAVEVYGRRDVKNNVIAKSIRNTASGTMITPTRSLSAGAVRMITLLLLCLIAAAAVQLGPMAIVWVVVLVLCLTNIPVVFKIIGVIFAAIFSFIKRLF